MKRLSIATCAAMLSLFIGGTAQAGLTAYYDFEGNFNDYPGAGLFADDLVNQGNGTSIVAGGAANGPFFAKGSTQSYAFTRGPGLNTQDPRVSTAAFTTDLTSTDQYTIMFWLKMDDMFQDPIGGNNIRLATVKYNAANAATPEIGWQIEGINNGATGPDLRIQGAPVGNFFAPDANPSLTGVNNNNNPADDLWYHIAYVVSNSGGPGGNAYMETFVNGTSVGIVANAAATGGTDLRNVNGRLILGGHNSTARSATGFMDDFALFDMVLSDTDILLIAEGQLSPADFLGGPAIPEPATFALLMLGGALGLRRQRRAA